MFHQKSSDSFDILFGYYRKLIWKRSHQALASGDIDTADVEDFFQEGAIGFYQALYSFRPELNVGLAYYIDLCVNSSIKTYQRKYRTMSYRLINSKNSLDLYISEDHNMTLLDTIPCTDFNNCPANMALYHEVNETRLEYVSGLSCDEQDIFEMHEEGYSYKEIADTVGVSTKDVDNTIQKIRRNIKNKYND